MARRLERPAVASEGAAAGFPSTAALPEGLPRGASNVSHAGDARVTVSVVVPAFNEEALLPGSLGAIRAAMGAFDRRGWGSELVVCDNNSTDRTAAIAREAGAVVAFEPINQIGRARNTGAAHATGTWIVFVDADSYPTEALFAAIADAIDDGRCLAGGSTIALQGTHGRLVRLMTSLWNAWSRMSRWAAGSLIFCEANAFRAVGGFDHRFFAGEEIDLFRRLKRRAHRERRRVVILHDHPLHTSDRKVHLYTTRELMAFVIATIVSGGRTLQSGRTCPAWYDGRR
jgi:glycosyltransferase involved in cell wall biosynthesis